jgi:uncharacterized membrane protein
MDAATQIAALWVGFAGSHIVLSSVRLRARLAGALGEGAFLGLYSLVAFAFFVPLVAIYWGHRHEGVALWTPGVEGLARMLLYVGMGAAFVLIVSSLISAGPAAIRPGSLTPRGVYRITRHPQNMGFALFGALHVVANPFPSDVAFFGGFVVFGILGSWHQDLRKRVAGPPGFDAFVAATPFFPFTGRDTLRGLRELSPLALGIGIALTVLLRTFHAQLFGAV